MIIYALLFMCFFPIILTGDLLGAGIGHGLIFGLLKIIEDGGPTKKEEHKEEEEQENETEVQ